MTTRLYVDDRLDQAVHELLGAIKSYAVMHGETAAERYDADCKRTRALTHKDFARLHPTVVELIERAS